jgi:hypothetical protein
MIHGRSVDERATDLMRLSRIISVKYGYVAFYHDEDRLPAKDTGITRIFPVPSDALRNHHAALQAGQTDWPIKEIRR